MASGHSLPGSFPRSPRVLLIFGTRPEAIKLFPVIRALNTVQGLTVRTCVTAQHRGLLDQVLGIAGITPDLDLDLGNPRLEQGFEIGQLRLLRISERLGVDVLKDPEVAG
jgi:UDP-N-acetylglucosamine 2-epimerase